MGNRLALLQTIPALLQFVRRFPHRVELGYALLVFALATGILITPPAIGMADNGDFERIMYQPEIGLAFTTADPHLRYFNWVNRYFAVVGGGHARYPSSLALLLQPAIAVSRWLYGAPVFDISVLAVFYAVLLAAAAFFALGAVRRAASPWVTGFVGVVGLIVFCDVAYIAYFGSLYSEAISFVSFMLTMGFALDLLTASRPRLWVLGAFAASAAAFGTAKLQLVPLAVIIALFTVRLAWIRRDRTWKIAAAACSVLIATAAVSAYVLTPRSFSYTNLYHSVFDGILVQSSNRAADLRELHLDPQYGVLAGTSYFDRHPINVRGKEFMDHFFRRIGWGQVAGFYLRHPERLLAALEESHRASLAMRPRYLGNYPQSSGLPAKTLTHRFSVWSDLKSKWFPGSIWFLFGYWLLYIGISMERWWKLRRVERLGAGPTGTPLADFAGTVSLRFGSARPGLPRPDLAKHLAEFALLAGLLALVQFPIPYLAEGRNELVKHLYTYDVLWDTTLVISATWAVARLEAAVRARRRVRASVGQG